MIKKYCFVVFVTLSLLVTSCEMRKRKDKVYPSQKELLLQRKETTPVDFTRLLVMRVVYGLAKAMGFEEPISEVLGGALVPPGANDDDDDYLFGDDDDGDDIFDGDDY